MKFTDRYIQTLKPKEQRYEVLEGLGFSIRVTPTGTRTFFMVYQFEGRNRRLTLGGYPEMKLAEARQKHADARQLLAQGIDPGAVAQTAKAEERATPTVAALVDEYIEKWAKPRKRTWAEDHRMLHKDVVPLWGTRKVTTITRRDVLTLLSGIVDRGAGIVANRTLEVVRRMFNYAIEQSILEVSPCNQVRAPAQEQRRDRVLTEDEIRVFWHGLDQAGMSEGSRLALRFLLVTAQRKSEVVEAPWSEFDLAGGWWVIPAERAKNKMAHRVPLSAGAKALLTRAKELSGESPYLFPSPRNINAPVGGTSVDHALHRALATLGLVDVIPHDLRRTAASLMTGMGISRLVVSKLLNHVEQGITAVYDRHSYDREKRQALEAWDRQLTAILTGTVNDNVVQLRAMA
ncbi:MAG: tyrosine-type recombinase/integrase [Magnetococcales bacterium]|nr:tyrosine-type recombinase/integrase [Magnetococcales bacterium]